MKPPFFDAGSAAGAIAILLWLALHRNGGAGKVLKGNRREQAFQTAKIVQQ
jgi:hypothetical protein